MKLYKVKLNNYGRYGEVYAVADNSDEAYKLVKKYLDEQALCYSDARLLKSVELLADEKDYEEAETLLIIKQWEVIKKEAR